MMEFLSQVKAWLSHPLWEVLGGRVRRVWLWAGWLAFGLLCTRLILRFLSPLNVVAAVLCVIAFCFPGWVLVSLMWGGDRATRRPELWLWGGFIGLTLCTWLATIEAGATGMPRGMTVLGLDLLAMLAWFGLSRRRGFAWLSLRPWSLGERVLWQLVSLWILTFLYHALAGWGETDLLGFYIYPRAFAAEVMGLVSNASAIGAGFPFTTLAFSDVTVPLTEGIAQLPAIGRYWMAPASPMAGWVVVCCVLIAIGFGGLIVSVLRTAITDLRRLVLAVFLIFFAYSFHWIYSLFNPSLSEAIGLYGGAPWTISHQMMTPLLYRWLLSAPQTLLTLGAWFLSVAWIRTVRKPPARRGFFLIGLMAGALAATDYYFGWISIIAGATWIIVLLIQYPHDRLRTIAGADLYIIAVAAMIVISTRVGAQPMFPLWRFQVVWSSANLLSVPARLAVLYGPMLAFGVWGLVRSRQEAHSGAVLTWCVIAVLSLVLMIATKFPAHQSLGLRVGSIVFFALVVLSLLWFPKDTLSPRGIGGWGLVALVILALPTVLIDYVSAGTNNAPESRLLIHPADHASADWAHDFLPIRAVVQGDPVYTDYSASDPGAVVAISWGTHLALRRTAVGPRQLAPCVTDSIYEQRHDAVGQVMAAPRPDSIQARALRLGIEYLYVGPGEMARHPLLRARLTSSPELFEAVYEQDSAGIYKVYPQSVTD
jgi:hypothetical protein